MPRSDFVDSNEVKLNIMKYLLFLKQKGVATPALFLVDLERRSIYMEYIENARTLKDFFDERAPLLSGDESQQEFRDCISFAEKLAEAIAKLHLKNIIHGDLTTSNVLIRERVSEKGTSHEVIYKKY